MPTASASGRPAPPLRRTRPRNQPLSRPCACATLVGVVIAATFAVSAPTHAQGAGATPQERYQRQLAYCNSGQLPTPQRDACVRDAGHLLDARLGGTPTPVQQTSPDGQSTVIAPPNEPVPSGDPKFITSPDGRAEIGVPATPR